MVVACDRDGNAPLGSVGVARYLTIVERVECTNDARPRQIFRRRDADAIFTRFLYDLAIARQNRVPWAFAIGDVVLNLEKGHRQVKARLPLR